MPKKRDAQTTFMSPQDFIAYGERMYGQGWQTTLASVTGYSRAHIVKYVAGSQPIPAHVALLVYLMAAKLDDGAAVYPAEPVGTVDNGAFTALTVR